MYVPRLRVLLDPVYMGVGNLSSSSSYFRYVKIVEELVRRNHFVYWCIPDTEYTPHEIENHPQVGVIRTTVLKDQFIADGLVTDAFFNLFNRMAGKYHVDVLCTSKNSLALYYKRLLEAPRYYDSDGAFTDKTYSMPVILIEDFPQTRKRQHSARAYLMSQFLGYVASDATIFSSNHCQEEMVEEMKEYITASKIGQWLEKSRVIPYGIDCQGLDKVYSPDRWKVEGGFQVISLGRIIGNSHVKMLPWFDYLHKSGIDGTCLTISLGGKLSGPMRAKLAGAGFDFSGAGRDFVIKEHNKRENFIKMLNKFHAFIVPVSHLDYPTAVMEAVYLGVPGIMPVSDYQQTFFPDYPFVINPKKPEDLISALKFIHDDPARARKMVAPWREVARNKHDANINLLELVDMVEDSARRVIDNFTTSKGVLRLIQELKGEQYGIEDVMSYLKTAGKIGVSIGNLNKRTTFFYAKAAIHHGMRYTGYVDDCAGPDPNFIRRDIFDRNSVSIGDSDGLKIPKKKLKKTK